MDIAIIATDLALYFKSVQQLFTFFFIVTWLSVHYSTALDAILQIRADTLPRFYTLLMGGRKDVKDVKKSAGGCIINAL